MTTVEVVLGVTRDPSAASARRALHRGNAAYENVQDSSGRYLSQYADVVPQGLPNSALLVGGRVVAVNIGPFSSYAQLRAGIRRLTR